MSDAVPVGTRVQVSVQVLGPDERAPGVPGDTAVVPYVLRWKGTLVEACAPGESATVRTLTGRLIEGVLDIIEPADTHSFGAPPPALVEVQAEISALMGELGGHEPPA